VSEPPTTPDDDAAPARAGRRPTGGKSAAARIVFDDPFSGASADDSDRGWGERQPSGRDDSVEWYLREKPPHHG